MQLYFSYTWSRCRTLHYWQHHIVAPFGVAISWNRNSHKLTLLFGGEKPQHDNSTIDDSRQYELLSYNSHSIYKKCSATNASWNTNWSQKEIFFWFSSDRVTLTRCTSMWINAHILLRLTSVITLIITETNFAMQYTSSINRKWHACIAGWWEPRCHPRFY